MKLIITWGLPGSGKTNYAKDTVKTNNINYRSRKNIIVVTYDDCDWYGGSNKKSAFKSRLSGYLDSTIDVLIADTLITTHEGFSNFIKEFNLKKVKSIEIQFWREDREACMWNDKYRRSENSEITIMNAPLEKPDVAKIKEMFPTVKDVTLVTNNVIRKSNWKLFADKYSIPHTDGIVKSDTWSLGGTSGNCWDSTLHNVSGEAPLTSFVEFDTLLETVCPSITFLQYKKIYNNCVTTDTSSESDYYGGSTSSAFYQYEVEKLYNELSDLNLVNLD
jgi:hypothetical protein